MKKQKVLFVCIHNSARSQMAEAFLNRFCGERFEAKSGEIETGRLNPLVIEAMQEIAIDISRHQAKPASDFVESSELFDYVITVCDETSAERCPISPNGAKRLHWNFPDPSQAQGSHKEKLAQLRAIRDSRKTRVDEFCAEHVETASR